MFSFFWLICLWIKEAFFGFFRNLGWNMAAIFLSIFCLFGFGFSYIAGENAKYLSSQLGDKVEIQVDIKENFPPSSYRAINDELTQLKEVKEVSFVSKEQAYKDMKEKMGDNADVLEVLENNPFPARFIVKLTNPNDVKKVAQMIERKSFAETVEYGKGYVEKLLFVTKTISTIGYIVTILIALATIYIVSSVIKFNIDQRKQEIHIKQLTGAGLFTIRFPFILEALVITVFSSLLVCILFYASYYKGMDFLHFLTLYFPPSYEKGLDYFQTFIAYLPFTDGFQLIKKVSLYVVSLAVVIGIIGSIFSTQRNVKRY